MLKVHTTAGLTSRVDLENEDEARQWIEKLRDPAFQQGISGLTIYQKGVQYSLPKPQGFGQIFLCAEFVEPDPDKKLKGGEKLVCVADDVRIVLMVHKAQKAVRVAVIKTGKQRFNPVTG